ncbi:DUF402 domain-containing protein [Agromyces sp. LHK192]|uniref:DUF402 domain-containing protein n=1 Tax=Agromyces sp. LHK192 TaxID=2498704 RepID=UPI000FD745AA|nr:DUF402 domain-containing protein [Agromyces sp. LHK192]
MPPVPDGRPSAPGTPVRVRYTKWDGSPHWAYDGIWLGRDEHGEWVGYPRGTRYSRPGRDFEASWSSVGLFPDAGWTPGFNFDGYRTPIYVDVSSTPTWSRDADGGYTVTMHDLDLDVVLRSVGEPYIDDEDEFAEHRAKYGYPDEVVARVEADADAVLAAMQRFEAPFDGATAERWRHRLEELAAG